MGVVSNRARGFRVMKNARAESKLETSDRLKKLWLVNINGYMVTSTRRTPLSGVFGKIRYKNIWVLEKKGQKAA